MMRGFNNALLCIATFSRMRVADRYAPKLSRRAKRGRHAIGQPLPRLLLGVKLHYQALVDVLSELRAVRRTLERAGHLLHVDFDPRREADLLGELERILDAELPLAFFGDTHQVAGAHLR